MKYKTFLEYLTDVINNGDPDYKKYKAFTKQRKKVKNKRVKKCAE